MKKRFLALILVLSSLVNAGLADITREPTQSTLPVHIAHPQKLSKETFITASTPETMLTMKAVSSEPEYQRFVSYNLHRGVKDGSLWQVDTKPIIETLAELNFTWAGLQEIWGQNQVEEIALGVAELMGVPIYWSYQGTTRGIGNAILSTKEFSEAHSKTLPKVSFRYETRKMMWVDMGDGVVFANAHIDYHKDALAEHVEAIYNQSLEWEKAVIAGDFQTHHHDVRIRTMRMNFNNPNKVHFPTFFKTLTELDYLWLKNENDFKDFKVIYNVPGRMEDHYCITVLAKF